MIISAGVVKLPIRASYLLTLSYLLLYYIYKGMFDVYLLLTNTFDLQSNFTKIL